MSVIIKRYRNRKLYNTQTKRYITLDEIEELIKDKKEVEVVDNGTGNDITASTLSQIIFGKEKNQTGVLPIDLLISLVESGGKRIDEIRRNIFISLNLAHQFDAEIEKRVELLIEKGEISQELGTQMMGKLLSVGYKREGFRENVEGKIIEFIKERPIPTRDDFQTIISRIETLSNRIDGYNIDDDRTDIVDKEDQIIE